MDGLKIGLVADTHHDQSGLMKRAVRQMGPIDYLIHLGDFLDNYNEEVTANPYSPYKYAARMLRETRDKFGLKNVFVIPGNHDIRHPENGLYELEEFSIHEQIIEVEGFRILGYGGGYDFYQGHGWNRLNDKRFRNNPDRLEFLLRPNDIDILFMHQIESKTKSLRPIIDQTKTKVVISGHTHKHGVECYERPLYGSCGPIKPLDPRNHKIAGNSSYGKLTINDTIARFELYFFKKDRSNHSIVPVDNSELDMSIQFNFKHY